MKEVAVLLKITKTETALRWCFDNEINTFKLANKYVVSEYDFRLVYEKPVVNELKKKYKDNWVHYYNAYDSEDITAFHRLDTLDNTVNHMNTKYNSDEFLDDIRYEES